MLTKEKILESYKKGLAQVNLKCVQLTEDKTINYKGKIHLFKKGTMLMNDTDENIGKWLHMTDIVGRAWKQGIISLAELEGIK